MTISQEQLQNIANLSKLKLQNPAKLEKDLNNILAYVEELNNIDTHGVIPTVNVVKTYNRLREDEIKNCEKDMLSMTSQKVVANQIALNNIMK